MTDRVIDEYYSEYYNKVHSTGLLGKINAIMHRYHESLFKTKSYEKILELGGGNFEHSKFVKCQYSEYLITDIRVPPSNLVVANTNRTRTFAAMDAYNLRVPDGKFDRVFMSCLILHLSDVTKALNEWKRVTAENGQIDFLVPCDPGLALRIFRKLVSKRHAAKIGANHYDYVNTFEHINSFHRIEMITKFWLPEHAKLKIHYFPFSYLKSWNLNAFAIFEIKFNKKSN